MTASLHKIDPLPQDNRADIKALCEDLIERAEAGELSSIAVAIVYKDGNTGDCWSPLSSISLQIGAMERLKHKLMSDT